MSLKRQRPAVVTMRRFAGIFLTGPPWLFDDLLEAVEADDDAVVGRSCPCSYARRASGGP
jgi:hypothetical protein